MLHGGESTDTDPDATVGVAATGRVWSEGLAGALQVKISDDMRDEAKRKHNEKHRVDRTVRQGNAK
jgi:hypothetical protein